MSRQILEKIEKNPVLISPVKTTGIKGKFINGDIEMVRKNEL